MISYRETITIPIFKIDEILKDETQKPKPLIKINFSKENNAGGGIRTHEGLRHWTLNPAPLTTRQPPPYTIWLR